MNYILFYPDELRATGLSCYGNPVVETPNFDRLVAEGTLFENNYTPHPVCLASRCSLMTGWYPHVGGYRTLYNWLQPHEPNFMRSLREAGFTTHQYGRNHVFSHDTFAQSFDRYVYSGAERGTEPFIQGEQGAWALEHTIKPAGGPGCVVEDQTMMFDPMPNEDLERMDDTFMVEAGIRAIREWKEGDKPFFMFFPTFYPHPPYVCVEAYQNRYDWRELPPLKPADAPNKPLFHALIRHYRELGAKDDELLRKVHAAYLGMCSYTDMLLGRILDALDETGRAADTTVIAASDHGDWAGDWGLVEKWPSAMDDDITKVPLIIRRPGEPAGHKVKELTQTFDIFPTVFDWEGIELGHDQFGVSLASQVAGAAGDPDRAVYCEGGYDVREPQCFEGYGGHVGAKNDPYYPKRAEQQEHPESVSRTVMLRNARYKLVVRTSGDNELYDIESDPNELVNLYASKSHDAEVRDLERQMLEWLITTSDVVPHR